MKVQTMNDIKFISTALLIAYSFFGGLMGHAYCEIDRGTESICIALFVSVPIMGGIWLSLQLWIDHLIKKQGEKPTACFIATAAYGTPLHENLDILRNFRDTKLNTNILGRTFVNSYYVISPPIAQFISNCKILRWIVRQLIKLVILVI